ncbi:DNA topoisomerase 3-alpha [Nymphon striatum]|nr:DNA topoisomerase 3-alpha [Nymphon striatum]KAG1657403.1 DNA topoisomerase 3-alpha [Nymphon striatum]
MPLTVLFLFVAWFKQRSSHLSPGINTGLTETDIRGCSANLTVMTSHVIIINKDLISQLSFRLNSGTVGSRKSKKMYTMTKKWAVKNTKNRCKCCHSANLGAFRSNFKCAPESRELNIGKHCANPCNYWLFLKLKNVLKGQEFPDILKLDEALSKHFGPPTAFTHADWQAAELNIVCPCASCGLQMALKQRKNGNGFNIYDILGETIPVTLDSIQEKELPDAQSWMVLVHFYCMTKNIFMDLDSTFFFNLNSGTSTRGHALKFQHELCHVQYDLIPFVLTQKLPFAVLQIASEWQCQPNLSPRLANVFYIGCMSYPNCKSSIWFPNYVESVSIDNSVCQQVNVLPYIYCRYTGCIGGCDNLFLESLGIQSTPRNVPNITSSDIASTFSNENEISNNRTYSLDSGYTSFNSRENNRSSSQNPRQNPSVFTSARSVADSHASSSFSNCNNSQRNLNSRRNTDLSQHNPPVRQIQMNASTSNISNASTSAGRSSSSRISPPPEEPVTLVCGCGHDAILLTVRKAGKNQGRQFYKCSKSEGSGCDFFQWADYQVDENSSNFSDPSHALCTLKHPQCSFQIVVKVGAVPLTFKIVRTMCVYWAIERSEVGIRPRSGARSDIPKAEAYLATPGESGDFSYNCSNKIPIFFHSKFLFPFYFIRSLAQRSDYLIQNYKMSILEIPQKETQEEESVLFVINQVLFLTSNLRNYRYEYVMSISSHLCIILWVWNNLIIVLLNGNNNNNRNQIFLRTQKRGGRKKNTNYSNESCFRKKKYFLPLTRIKPAHPSLQVWCAIRYTTEVNGVY